MSVVVVVFFLFVCGAVNTWAWASLNCYCVWMTLLALNLMENVSVEYGTQVIIFYFTFY